MEEERESRLLFEQRYPLSPLFTIPDEVHPGKTDVQACVKVTRSSSLAFNSLSLLE
jgi:hypothetical protein